METICWGLLASMIVMVIGVAFSPEKKPWPLLRMICCVLIIILTVALRSNAHKMEVRSCLPRTAMAVGGVDNYTIEVAVYIDSDGEIDEDHYLPATAKKVSQ